VQVSNDAAIPGPPGDAVAAEHPPGWTGPLVGVISMSTGLVLAELVAGAFATAASPLVEVGNRVVDIVPEALREWAISTFGINDKLVLLAGVTLALAVVSSVAGVLAVRGHRVAAVCIVVAVAALGAASSLGRGGAGGTASLATLLGGAVSAFVLWWLSALATNAWPSGHQGSSDLSEVSEVGGSGAVASRRHFFRASGAVAGAALLGAGLAAWLRSTAAVAAERLGIELPPPLEPLPEVPPDVEVDLEGVSPFFTPNDDFYRIDTALTVPRVSTDGWQLRIHGLVDRVLTLDYRELLARPMIEADATIACVSNQVGGDLIGNARWLGCRLDALLEEAGIEASADQIVGRSVDGFTAGFPTATLDGRDAIVAVGMNGEVLPTAHGYPARLVVPGLFGYVSATKWLAEIELTRFEDFEGYWIPRGWDRDAPVTTSSRFDTPKDRSEVAAGERFGVGGVAWAMIRGIETVEVQVDEGPWEPAVLGEQYSGTTWRQWRHALELEPGEHRLAVRATDDVGHTQSAMRALSGPNASSGHHTITVNAH
jgi:DMSO/TMAO reductase YedYZ molybdopterin-dependent catalytic subunit